MSVPEPKAAFGRVPCQVAKVPKPDISRMAITVSVMRTIKVAPRWLCCRSTRLDFDSDTLPIREQALGAMLSAASIVNTAHSFLGRRHREIALRATRHARHRRFQRFG